MIDALKVDRLSAAYSKLRISGLTVDPNPSDLELALNELENMMAELASRGIEVSNRPARHIVIEVEGAIYDGRF